jgi:hypothetical protein
LNIEDLISDSPECSLTFQSGSTNFPTAILSEIVDILEPIVFCSDVPTDVEKSLLRIRLTFPRFQFAIDNGDFILANGLKISFQPLPLLSLSADEISSSIRIATIVLFFKFWNQLSPPPSSIPDWGLNFRFPSITAVIRQRVTLRIPALTINRVLTAEPLSSSALASGLRSLHWPVLL